MKQFFSNVQRKARIVLSGALVVAGASLGLISPASANDADAATDVGKIVDAAMSTVTALGGLAVAAFGIAISPFAGKIAMLSIGSVFKGM